MKTNTKASSKGETLREWAVATFVFLAGVIFTLGAGHAHAAPAAGTVIGNQATATYTDASSTPRTATSNLVQTTVSQVKTFTLTANGARTASPGQTVYYPHTITNTGNGTDTYTLTVPSGAALTNFAGAAAPHSGLAYYADANGDGLPDNATPITSTGALTAGGIFRFVVAGTVPAAAANGDSATIQISVSDTQVTTLTNTDTTTVASSVISVTKAIGPTTTGPAGVTLTVTLSYTNSGTVAASTVTLTDNVATGGFTYVANSGVWSASGTALTDAAGGDPAGINYTASGNVVTAVIASVAPGISGTVSFQVQVPAGRAPGVMPNTASYSTSTQASANTNTASYTVLQTASVVANGSVTSSVDGTNEPVTVASAPAGSTVDFTNVIWNKGNAADTFVISMSPAGWPAGTTFTLLQSDGATSLIANTTPSIPAYAGASCGGTFVTDSSATPACGYRVILRVQLPASASGGPYSVTKTATSTFDNTKSNPVTDTLTVVAANTVDITNNAAVGGGGALGTGAGPGASLVTNSVTPSPSGTTATTFRLFVTNTGAVPDNYNLSVAGVPAGWSVTFFNDGGGSCTTLGASLTSTGALAVGANKAVCAVVTVPSTVSGNAGPGSTALTFTATSSTNGTVLDSLIDTVTVTTVNNVTLAPPNTQQTFPGGSVTYSHVLTNNGNVTESITWLALTDSQSASGWSSAGYVDANGNGVFDAGIDDVAAQLIPGGANASFTLAPGATRTIFVRVFAPGSLTATNVTTVTARYAGNTLSATVTDSTSITDGLVLTKSQRTVACNGTAPGVYTTGSIAAGPGTAPGQCLQYQVAAQNTTAANITSVTISDVVPGNTKVVTTGACAASATAPGVLGVVTAGMAAPSAVTATVATMTPSQTVTVTFCVQIDP